MAEIIRNRTIRPSSRLEKSKSYKIDTKVVSHSDTLVVNIDHESNPFKRTYKFKGADVASKDSISFRVFENGTSIDITWSGEQPIGSLENIHKTAIAKESSHSSNRIVVAPKNDSSNNKQSFDPISNAETSILILGTMPGDKSLELNEYYAHHSNRFWKIIATITNYSLPLTYVDKMTLLLKTKIGLWDVARNASRLGSLDSAIENEVPNDLDNFISTHKNLKVIGFNGSKSEVLFDKYFTRRKAIKYVSLPSTSPANTTIDFTSICNQWKKIF